jgi:hypothetical protein
MYNVSTYDCNSKLPEIKFQIKDVNGNIIEYELS